MDETVVGEEGIPRPGNEAGDRLRAAREKLGLSLADIGARTRVPLRHLEAIERGDYRMLPSQTYAVGFARAYARAVGVDEVGVAADVRAELSRIGPRTPDYQPYELPDPARMPSRGLAILGAGAALALLILAALWFGTDLLGGRASVTSQVPAEATPSPVATPSPAAPAPSPSATAGGQVRLTASDEVWLRVYDADDKTLFLGTMKAGDHFDVPADAKDPKINVGRPDKLAVTLNGAAVPPLGNGDRPIKDVAVGSAAIAARLSGQPVPSPSSTPVGSPTAAAASGDGEPREAARPRPPKKRLTETQRANLEAAGKIPPPPATNGP